MAIRGRTAELISGACVLIVAFGFLGYAVAHSGRSAASGYELTARFDRIDGLAIGADVRVSGVKVGTVDTASIDPQTYQAVVSLSVRNDLKLPTDTSAEVISDGLLGGKYLALVPGGADKMLQPGQTITITQSSVSLEQLLGKFIFSITDSASGKAKAPDATAPDAKVPDANPGDTK